MPDSTANSLLRWILFLLFAAAVGLFFLIPGHSLELQLVYKAF